jgi:hypothetical protein
MALNRRTFLRGAATAAALYGSTGQSSGAPQGAGGGGPVTCRVVDQTTGQPLAARVRLVDSQGREVVPLGHAAELTPGAQEGDVGFQSRRYCYIDGSFQVTPSQLPLRYQIVKGHEYQMADGELAAPAAGNGAVTVPLSRLSALSESGWYSGDVHIHHIAPRTCRLEMDAEDLNVANILTSDFTLDQREFEGKVNAHSSGKYLIYVNQEFRNHQLGHLCLLNLKKLVEPVTEVQEHHHPLHLRVCDETHEQGGYVSWAHFPSWPGVESPLDVAMEKLDGLEFMSVLEPRRFPLFMRQVVPDWEANDGIRLWYRYLNCGFPLTATAGTDKMTTFVTVGANRVYARVEGEFTYANWMQALKTGRTFITNSPILSFTVNGQEAGSRLDLNSARSKSLEIRARAESQLPYHHLEIVCNGRVIGEATPSGRRFAAEIHLEHPLAESCWVAARAYEDIDGYYDRGVEFDKIHQPEGTLLSNYFGTRRPETVFAHTSPVYVQRDGQPIRSWDDAQYYIRYMDRSMNWIEKEARFASEQDRKSSVEAFRIGRAVYEQRAKEARRA